MEPQKQNQPYFEQSVNEHGNLAFAIHDLSPEQFELISKILNIGRREFLLEKMRLYASNYEQFKVQTQEESSIFFYGLTKKELLGLNEFIDKIIEFNNEKS